MQINNSVHFDAAAKQIIQSRNLPLRIVSHRPSNKVDERVYYKKAREIRDDHHIRVNANEVIFLEVMHTNKKPRQILVTGHILFGSYKVLRASAKDIPSTIANILFQIRDATNEAPHVYFSWFEYNPVRALWDYITTGSGDIPFLVRQKICTFEPYPTHYKRVTHEQEFDYNRPVVHIGG